jgi:hypothetical protein
MYHTKYAKFQKQNPTDVIEGDYNQTKSSFDT